MTLLAPTDQEAVRREKLSRIRDLGHSPYPNRFAASLSIHEVLAARDLLLEAPREVRVMGRVLGMRVHGRAAFIDLLEDGCRLQIHVRHDRVAPDQFDLTTDLLDLGDWIGVAGSPFVTRTGAFTVEATAVTLLSKALRPQTEKRHGLRDVEARYRQRYVDLAVNPEARDVLVMRSRVVSAVRGFLSGLDFLEVETPILQPLYGGAAARPFVTHHNTLDQDLFLRIAPELYLKRLIVGGLPRVFEIGRNFRNEGLSPFHNPEFTMLEAYQAGADYNDMMALVEALVVTVASEVRGSLALQLAGQDVDLTPPWCRVTLADAVAEHAGVHRSDLQDESVRRAVAARHGLADLGDAPHPDAILEALFETEVQPRIVNPTFVTDYPALSCPLAKARPDDPTVVERFELFCAGQELANAYSELNDPDEQRRRFLEQATARGETRIDEDYVRALEFGMPPTGGLGIGIDRLAMLITGARSIRDVIYFPLLRPEGKGGESGTVGT